jgi:hypothetical protein
MSYTDVKVMQGQAFTFTEVAVKGVGGMSNIMVVPNGGVDPVATLSVRCSGAFTVNLYSDVETSSDGTLITGQDSNDNDVVRLAGTYRTWVKFYRTPTVTSSTLLQSVYVPAGAAFETGTRLLKGGIKNLMTITSQAAANNVSIVFKWTER